MIGIHPVHRRLAELHLIARRRQWTYAEVQELRQCMQVNANLVRRLDELKHLALHAYEVGDMDWHNDICAKIDQIEATIV